MADQKSYAYLDPRPLARAVVVWIWTFYVADVSYAIVSLIRLEQLPISQALNKYEISLTISWVYLLVFAVSGFLILKWIYRVSRNAHSFTEGLRVSPPWAVGWYFVPVAFLWKPFQAMRETWQASAQPTDWKQVPVPAVLRWWWGLWLVWGFLGNLSLRLVMKYPLESTLVDIVGNLVAAPLCITLIVIVRDLTHLQTIEASDRAAPTVAA